MVWHAGNMVIIDLQHSYKEQHVQRFTKDKERIAYITLFVLISFQ